MEEKNPYLSGCVFYLLLRKAAYTETTARQRRGGIKDNHKNPIFMSDLVYTFTGTQTRIASSDISVYREGFSEGTSYMPFNDPSDISSYDYAVRNRYADALKRMCEFAEWHLNPDKREWLVKAFLDIIENDADIMEQDELCIKSGGTFVSKAAIRNETVFEYQPFLVGILHFILMHRADKNRLGVQTLDANTYKVKYKERKYNGHLGDYITRPIAVHWYGETDDKAVRTSDAHSIGCEKLVQIMETDEMFEKSDNKVIHKHLMRPAQKMATALETAKTPKINTDTMVKGVTSMATAIDAQKHQLTEQISANSQQDGKTSQNKIPEENTTWKQEPSDDKKTTVIRQQTNVIQNGGNNVNVTNNGTINFNF